MVSNNEKLHTHQVMTGPRENSGATTTIVDAGEYPPSKPLVKAVKVELPNAENAIEYQKQKVWEELGPYSKKTTLC
ncbi:hypothetical protein [Microbulbifer litoralis]|uniref:hypothetical protein n=1 Tax=Microbulbifer litoralis TaxID=2933965 RepID=UPI002028A2D3|nr:hypothetical protein [Microbulbifer sp. GX H0434]